MLKTTMYEFNKNDDNFSDLKWLISVKQAPGDTRDYTKLVMVKNGWAHRSDGSMLKSVQLEIEHGGYIAIKSAGFIYLGFIKEFGENECPDFAGIYQKFNLLEHTLACDGLGGWARCFTTVTMQSKQIFDAMKFRDLCNDLFGEVYHGAGEDAVFFCDASLKKKGLLMPIKQ